MKLGLYYSTRDWYHPDYLVGDNRKYDTPEGSICAMNLDRDWESCIHVGQGWSYRGEKGFKGPDDCIKMLVSCTTGGGNLLLNFGRTAPLPRAKPRLHAQWANG